MRPKGPAAERPDLRPKVTRPGRSGNARRLGDHRAGCLEPLIEQETELFRKARFARLSRSPWPRTRPRRAIRAALRF